MRLTCPTCHSGLDVPDGTTALVRCPNCRGVFEPAEGRLPVRSSEPPRRGSFLEAKQARDRATAAANRQLRHEFHRAALGCRLLWVSYLCYTLSLFLLLIFLILSATEAGADVMLLVGAGVLGIINWILGAAAMGIVLSGPRRAQVRGHALAALIAAVLHLLLLTGLTAGTKLDDDFGNREAERAVVFADVPTQFVSLSAYLTWIVYQDRGGGPQRGGILLVLVGLAELVRLLFAMLALSALARAAGDAELSYQCIRAGTVVLFIVGGMVFGLLGFVTLMLETNFAYTDFGKVVLAMAWMALYALLAGMLLLPLRRAKDVQEWCEAPILSGPA